MRVEPEHRRDEIPSEPPGPVAMQEGTDRLAGEAPDDEAALADVDAGEFPPEPGGERASRPEPGTETGHATEDPWLRSENSPADEVSVGEPAGDEPAVGVASVPSPGEVTSPQDEREAEPGPAGAALWEAETIDEYRDRWQQLQLRFVDDPRQATEQAQALVGDVCQGLTDALDRHRSELDRWRGAQLDDTEELRMAVRRYRDLLDRILGL